MAASLKGNLGLKSSPLAPTASKLSTQHLVIDHMKNHFSKIANAKSAIDNRPPKSMSTSQKRRDIKNRERMVNSPRTRPISSMSQNFSSYHDVLADEPQDDDDRLVHSIMKATLMDNKTSHDATYGSTSMKDQYDLDARLSTQDLTNGGVTGVDELYRAYGRTSSHVRARPSSARSMRSTHSIVSQRGRLPLNTSHDPVKNTYNGDVLDKHQHFFTEPERPFTPRTLRVKNAESVLKKSKCYNPPKSATKRTQERSEFESRSATTSNALPKPQPRSRNGRKQQVNGEYRNGDLGDTMATSQLSESMLMDMTLRSRDGRHGDEEHQNKVPPLAISMDQDHMNWLQEQASKAEARVRSKGGVRSSIDSESQGKKEAPTVPRRNLTGLQETIRYETKENYVRSCGSSKSLASHYSASSWISQCLEMEDEEQKYLTFAKEVTDDVLSRGISTDSVLNRVFENHIERKKHELDETRMREVIKDLRRDLGLRDSVLDKTPLASLSDVNYNNQNRAGNLRQQVTVNVSSESTTNGLTSGPSTFNDLTSGPSSGPSQPISSASGSGTTTGVNGSKSTLTSTKEDTLSFTKTNGSSLEPLQVMSSPSENDMLSTTLESTSTMKFGQTADMFSTINSEATAEAEEERQQLEDTAEELTATQALRQYQFNLTAKEAMSAGSAREEEESNGEVSDAKETSAASSKLERPPTGERREADEEDGDAKSVTLSGKESAGSDSTVTSHRLKRRERARQATNGRNGSSAVATPLSGSESRRNSSVDADSTQNSIYTEQWTTGRTTIRAEVSSNGVTSKSQPTSSSGEGSGRARERKEASTDGDADVDDSASIKSNTSSLSQKPTVKPRARRREPRLAEDGNHEANEIQEKEDRLLKQPETVEERGREIQDKDNSTSAGLDSGLGPSSSHVAVTDAAAPSKGHDDTLEDTSEMEGQGQASGQQKEPKGGKSEEEYEDDYDEEFEEDEDGEGGDTHRTSDDDF